MTSLLIAHASLWLLMGGLAVLLVLLSRQIGALHRRVAPAGALAVNELLKVGLQAPELSVTTLKGSEISLGIVQHLLSGAEGTEAVLANNTVYVVPRLNPDGAEAMFAAVKTHRSGNGTLPRWKPTS